MFRYGVASDFEIAFLPGRVMAIADSLRVIVLFCPSCGLPMPFEDYEDTDIFIGKCAICGSEYKAKRKGQDRDRFEVKPKVIN